MTGSFPRLSAAFGHPFYELPNVGYRASHTQNESKNHDPKSKIQPIPQPIRRIQRDDRRCGYGQSELRQKHKVLRTFTKDLMLVHPVLTFLSVCTKNKRFFRLSSLYQFILKSSTVFCTISHPLLRRCKVFISICTNSYHPCRKQRHKMHHFLPKNTLFCHASRLHPARQAGNPGKTTRPGAARRWFRQPRTRSCVCATIKRRSTSPCRIPSAAGYPHILPAPSDIRGYRAHQ